MKITKSPVQLFASPKAVILQYLSLPGSERIHHVINRLEKFSEEEVNGLLLKVAADFSSRHRNINEIFKQHFDRTEKQFGKSLDHFSANRKLLLGSFFTKEYSIQAAALFNPSIVAHPDQSQLSKGQQRFVMSLRATGEGHISSIAFKSGIVDENGNVVLDNPALFATRLEKNADALYSKAFVLKCAGAFPEFKSSVLEMLPEQFTAAVAMEVLSSIAAKDLAVENSISIIENILDSNYELHSSAALPLNEKVIFPGGKAESMGMEDVRFVKFTDADETTYYGTYTAYNGHRIQTQMIQTKDFDIFQIRKLYGDAISDKGMALFPERINGKYVMISRQGGEVMNIMYADDLYRWDEYRLLLEPRFHWEIVQSGNCGSPVKTSEGWLLLTHGVGALRTYVIGAILLDLYDPSIVIKRLYEPLLIADEAEREGYVPNVVYTCGLMLHGSKLIIPYAVSDAATAFVTIELNELLNEMKP
ncbi:MAG: glycoside hydrolase family 130 protein [Chitinophagales bacterium]